MSRLTAPSYHATLALRDQGMMRSLPPQYRARQLDYIRRSQNADGGFSGRAQGSDPYYTSFALRSAAILGCDDQEIWRRASRYLRTCVPVPASVVDAFNLLHSIQIVQTHGGDVVLEDRFLRSIRALLDACRVEGGAFAMRASGEPSVYQTFLATLSYEMIGAFARGGDETLGFLNACRCTDGGFADKPDSAERGGTNPTCAAVAVLLIHGALDSDTARGAAAFIGAMQRDNGGLAAHADAPISDLLSTYSGLVALDKLGASGTVKLGRVGRFVQAMGSEEGGFRATSCDDAVDVEYTYYGLGTLALLTAWAMPGAGDASECGCHPSPERSGGRHEIIG